MHRSLGSMRPWRLATFVGVAASLVITACGGGGGGSSSGISLTSPYKPASGTTGGKLVFSDWEQVTDLNVVSTTATTTIQATNAIYSGLWAVDPSGKFVPDVAKEIPTQANGEVKKVDSTHMDVTVKLKSGLKFSDGTPITTNNIKGTWQAICDPATGASSTYGYDHISDMEIKSDTEMVWHFGPDPTGKRCGLSSPLQSGLFAAYLTLGYAPLVALPDAILKVPHSQWPTAPYFTQKPNPVSGPYMVQSFTPGSSAQVILVPNPHFADGRSGTDGFSHKPYLDQLTYKIYGDKPSQINGLKTGDTDLGLDLIAKDLPSLQGASNLTVKAITGPQYEMVLFNVGTDTKTNKKTIFADDQPLRQALDLATDKDAMNKTLVQGIGVPLYCPFPSTMKPWFNDSTCKAGQGNNKRDVSKANSLLDGDGWTKGADGMRTKNGQKCAIVLSTTSGNPQRAAEEEQLAANWKEVGCTTTFDNHPAGEFFGAFSEHGVMATGAFEAGLFTDSFSPDPDAWSSFAISSQIPTTANPAGANWGRWSDPKMDSLFAQGASEIDVSKRQSIYNDVQKEWQTYDGAIELYERPDVNAYTPNFGNIFPNAGIQSSSWNAVDWFRKGSS